MRSVKLAMKHAGCSTPACGFAVQAVRGSLWELWQRRSESSTPKTWRLRHWPLPAMDSENGLTAYAGLRVRTKNHSCHVRPEIKSKEKERGWIKVGRNVDDDDDDDDGR